LVGVGAQGTVVSGVNSTIVLNNNTYALVKAFTVKWGNAVTEEEVAGTDQPVPTTGQFHGEGEMEILYSTENVGQFATLILPTAGAINAVPLQWKGHDQMGSAIVFNVTSIYAKDATWSVAGEKSVRAKISFVLGARPTVVGGFAPVPGMAGIATVAAISFGCLHYGFDTPANYGNPSACPIVFDTTGGFDT